MSADEPPDLISDYNFAPLHIRCQHNRYWSCCQFKGGVPDEHNASKAVAVPIKSEQILHFS